MLSLGKECLWLNILSKRVVRDKFFVFVTGNDTEIATGPFYNILKRSDGILTEIYRVPFFDM